MPGLHVEYVGFVSRGGAREYTLRVRGGCEEDLIFTRLIEEADFLERRARYQDGPEICFSLLQREVAESPELPPRHATVSDGELASYKAAHAPRPPRRRTPPPVPADAPSARSRQPW